VLGDVTATEKDATNAKGYYIFDLTQAETNGNKILFSAKSSTANIVVIAVPAVVYTIPATFPDSTFPTGTIANTTNITAGTITTVTTTTTATNLTNLPSIPANWLTAAGINAGALNGKGDWVLASSAPANWSSFSITAGGVVKANDALGNALATAVSVSNIAVTGAALNTTAASSTITTGTGTGGFANAATADLVYDNVADAAGTIDFYYQFNLSGTSGATAVGVQWTGYVVGVVNTLKVYAYNWGATAWDQIGTVVGIAGTTNGVEEWELTNSHTGTGGNLGLVRIRFNATGLTSATVKTDRILCGYAVVPSNVDPWTIALPGSYGAGTAGNILGNDTDPWSIALPASYGAGSAGYILGTNLNATITSRPTAASIATTVWQDTTSADFTTASSPGRLLMTQLAGAFTGTGSVYTTASLVNAPTGGSAPTTAQIATAVWTDLLASSDFSTASSIGALLKLNTVASVTAAVTLPSIPSNWITAAGIAANALNGKGDWLLASSYTSPPSTASIATALWQDTTAGDFTTASSPGRLLMNQLAGAFTGTGSVYTAAALANAPSGTGASAATIATAVWQDTTAGDFTVAGSPGRLLLTQLSGAFTGTGSVFTTASLVNAPTGGSAPSAASIATAVWQDTTAGDFTTAGSPGRLLMTQLAGSFVGTGSVYTTASLVNAPGGSLTAAAVATAVWQDTTGADFTITGSPGRLLLTQLAGAFVGTGSVFAAASLVNAPGGVAPTVSQIDTQLTSTHGSGAWGGASVTPGAQKYPYTITIRDNAGAALPGTSVFLSDDNAGSVNPTSTLVSDGNGMVTFYLVPGHYYLWRTKTGVVFTQNPISYTTP
jgi:hypothetical protein